MPIPLFLKPLEGLQFFESSDHNNPIHLLLFDTDWQKSCEEYQKHLVEEWSLTGRIFGNDDALSQ
jgi:hypothetical protein